MPENLFTHPVHLGLGAKALAQPAFTGLPWYKAYAQRHASDGAEGRMTLHQQHADGTTATVHIGPGEYVINPPGCLHTADVKGEATALFITAVMGTEHRQR